jgi:hypothetical protein
LVVGRFRGLLLEARPGACTLAAVLFPWRRGVGTGRFIRQETIMSDALPLLAATDTIWTRLAVCAVASIVGALLIYTGVQNIKTRTAEESGKRRFVNQALGRSNSYTGGMAVFVGWMRVICGVAAIIFGIVFIFVGPFLAK